MSIQCNELENREGQALPRDVSRFKKLYPNGRAIIRDDATPTLGYISTIELISGQENK